MRDLKFYLFHSHPGIVSQVKDTVGHIYEAGYCIIDPADVMECIKGHYSDGKYAVLTFDDGREDRHPDIIDFLRQNRMKAISFLYPIEFTMASMRVDWDFWRNNLDVLEIGAHSLTHSMVAKSKGQEIPGNERVLHYRNKRFGSDFSPGLLEKGYDQLYDRQETDSEYRMRLESEVYLSKKMLERNFGVPCRFFSYPWGIYTPDLVEIVKQAGFEAAFSVKQTDGDVWSIPRIDMDSDQPKRETRVFPMGECRVLHDCA